MGIEKWLQDKKRNWIIRRYVHRFEKYAIKSYMTHTPIRVLNKNVDIKEAIEEAARRVSKHYPYLSISFFDYRDYVIIAFNPNFKYQWGFYKKKKSS